MHRILFVEDKPDSIATLIRHLERAGLLREKATVLFDEADKALQGFRPDIVVLDLLDGDGTAGSDAKGNSTLKMIWNSRFCPIVIYSAQTELAEPGDWSGHPFIAAVKKGAGSPEFVAKAIEAFADPVNYLQQAEYEVSGIYARALRDVAPIAYLASNEAKDRAEMIRRGGRRRLAAAMDLSESVIDIAPWEIYIFPPMAARVKLGDILRLRDGHPNDPTAFRIVLTPSCDMARDGNPRQAEALLAKCVTCDTGLAAADMMGAKPDRIQTHLLNAGHKDGILPLPALAGHVPDMMADLKRLEVVPLVEIGADKKYVRVASIDSPFRELVSWAYQGTACRPGLPVRALKSWAEALASVVKVKTS